jgi:hypothetical protein
MIQKRNLCSGRLRDIFKTSCQKISYTEYISGVHIMDYRKYYKPFLAPCGTSILDPIPASREIEYLQLVRTITECLEEIERNKLRQSISLDLKFKAIGRTDYVFLTVNFDPSKAFGECFKAAQKLGTRKIWEWAHWVHEQRSEDVEHQGTGHHMHLVAKIAAPNAKTRAKTTVCHVCSVSNSAIFHWKYIPVDYVTDKVAYITEPKAIEKQAKQEIDKLWRIANNISPSYYNANKVSEVPPQEASQATG